MPKDCGHIRYIDRYDKNIKIEVNHRVASSINRIFKELQSKTKYKLHDDGEELEKYNLTAIAHFASSFPFGSLLSTGYGYNVSYLTAEIYKENYYTSTGPVCSVSLCL